MMCSVLMVVMQIATPAAAVVPVEDRQAGLSLYVSGSGPVTIVLEAGAASDHRQWADVQRLLSPLGKVVSYDRAGYGGSPRNTRPPTAANNADQLRAALGAAGAEPPFILVGHSYGGALMRVFAAKYRDEVAGLVLVDPAMEGFYNRAAVAAPKAYLNQLEEDLSWSDGRATETVKREYLAYETSMAQVRIAPHDPRDRVVVLSARQMELAPELRKIWLQEQEKYARRVGARLVKVDGGHQFYRRRPQLVVAAVKSVLKTSSRP